MTYLADLPPDHPHRNTPLGDLNAEYRWKQAPEAQKWRQVKRDAPKLVAFTFNQLGAAWTDFDNWRVSDGSY